MVFSVSESQCKIHLLHQLTVALITGHWLVHKGRSLNQNLSTVLWIEPETFGTFIYEIIVQPFGHVTDVLFVKENTRGAMVESCRWLRISSGPRRVRGCRGGGVVVAGLQSSPRTVGVTAATQMGHDWERLQPSAAGRSGPTRRLSYVGAGLNGVVNAQPASGLVWRIETVRKIFWVSVIVWRIGIRSCS